MNLLQAEIGSKNLDGIVNVSSAVINRATKIISNMAKERDVIL